MTIPELVEQTARQYALDPGLALAVAAAESNFNPAAVSPAGAIGVMQLMPATAAALGVNPYDVGDNIRGGVLYLRQMLAQFNGAVDLALAAYNWGPGRVAAALASYGNDWLRHAPAETRSYVARILGPAGVPQTTAQVPALDPATGLPTFRVTTTSTPLLPDWAWLLLALLAVGVITS